MERNVCAADRVLRIVLGLVVLSLLLLLDGPVRWIGLFGLVPLLTGAIGWCPAYGLFGINTCRRAGGKDALAAR